MKIENNMGAHCKITWDKEWVNLACIVVKLHIRCGSNTMLIVTLKRFQRAARLAIAVAWAHMPNHWGDKDRGNIKQ